ncbi:MAG TPA: hypothetical protein VEW46_08140 [Pyrinomonadaceae bacterium]|nr:hypothetical protein [Pyrinomonadaceae bacterium]
MSTKDKQAHAFKHVIGFALCFAGFVLTLVAFSPGLMSADSVDQWQQGRAWAFNDVHPPMMSALWGIFDRIWSGPLLMLVFHNLFFWSGLALFWQLTKSKSFLVALAFPCIGFMPQIWAPLTTIWKDISLGASLLLAAALLYAADQKKSRAALFCSLPLMFYASGARLNAATATFPLALWSGLITCRLFPGLRIYLPDRARGILPTMLGLVYLVVLLFTVNLSTKALTDGNTLFPYQQILLHDLAGIAKSTGQTQFPSYLTEAEGFSRERLAETYTPCSVNSLIYGVPPVLKITTDVEEVGALRAKWRTALFSNPLTYLKQRAALYACLTGFSTQHVWMPFFPASGMNNPRPIKSPMNLLTRMFTNYFFFFSDTVLFRGFFWLLLAAGLIYLALRLRLDGELESAFVLATSGLLYGLGYFFYVPSSEFRYLWWTVLAASVATILFVGYLLRNWGRLRERSTAGLLK